MVHGGFLITYILGLLELMASHEVTPRQSKGQMYHMCQGYGAGQQGAHSPRGGHTHVRKGHPEGG